MSDLDLETWILGAGDAVLAKKQREGGLSPLDELVHCLWVADYGMRNAGDLETANDVREGFQATARASAAELGLPQSLAAFSLSQDELERRYFDLLEGVCRELQVALASPP